MLRFAAPIFMATGMLFGCGTAYDMVSRSEPLSSASVAEPGAPGPLQVFAHPPAARFVLAALAISPEVTATAAELADYEHRLDAVKWQIAPTPYVGATASQNDGAGARLGLRQPIWSGGRWRAEKALSAAEVKKAEAELAQVRDRVALDIVKAFADWAGAHNEVAALDASLAIHRDLGAQIERRFELGVASASEKVLLANRLDRTRLDLEVARNQAALARERLRLLVGEAADLPLTALLDQRFAPLAAEAPSPTVALARAEHDIAKATTKLAKAKTRPSIYLDAGHNISGGSGSYAQLGFDTAFLAGMGGAERLNGYAAAEESAARRVELALRTVRAVRAEARLNLDSAKAQLQLRQRMGRTQKELFDSYRRQFKLGDRRWLDLLNAAQELNGAQVARAHAEAEVIRANWTLAIQHGLAQSAMPEVALSEALALSEDAI